MQDLEQAKKLITWWEDNSMGGGGVYINTEATPQTEWKEFLRSARREKERMSSNSRDQETYILAKKASNVDLKHTEDFNK